MSNDPAVYTAKEYGALANNLPNHKAEPYYVTTAISYTNGYPHIGHAYEFISTDVLARYHRVLGYDTYFLTGTDEHGQKVAASAEKGGKTPLAHCDHYVESFKDLHKKLLVAYSKFIRTTDAYHELTSQQLWQKCADAGDIYLDSYEGWYNEREETFVTPAEAEASEFKDPGSGLPLKRVSEESYFFRMSKYCERLIAYIEENPSCIEPENHRLVILGRLKKEGLKDLSISRTSFSWGIPVPAGFDQRHVMYVWFDALTNYLSGVYGLTPDHPLYKYWPATKHIIGKDIVWFHCVIWPCMLMSAELPLPGGVFSHGFVNDEFGRKMSKSYNNTIDPFEILTKYPADSIRYYLSSCATYGADLNFSEKALIVMHNSELADILGNLVNRVVNLIQKYCGGVVPDTQHDPEFGLPFDLNALKTDVAVEMKSCGINGALFKAMEAARATNGFLTKAEPWKMKGENESRRGAVVRTALEAVYAFMHFLAPVIPMAAQSVFNMLHTDPVCSFLLKDDFYNLTPGTAVSVGEILFQKIEQPEDAKANAVSAAAPTAAAKGGKGKPAAAAAAEPEAVHAIDFTKLELRVGQITKVWHHETAERLFCEEVDLGVEGGGVRQIASGLREHYTLEDMLHRKVIVVCNMKESKFQGFLSNGMILAAKSAEGKVELVAPNAEAAVGQRVYVQGHGANVPAALAAAQVKKLKVWETVSADLRTNGSCEACWKGLPMMTAGDLVCSVPSLADAVVT